MCAQGLALKTFTTDRESKVHRERERDTRLVCNRFVVAVFLDEHMPSIVFCAYLGAFSDFGREYIGVTVVTGLKIFNGIVLMVTGVFVYL